MYQGQRNSIKINIHKKIGPPQATIARPHPKANSVRFDESYDHIHNIDHTHENAHLIDTQE